MSLDDLREAPVTGAVLNAATNRIMDAITALVAELRQEPPPGPHSDPKRPIPDREEAS